MSNLIVRPVQKALEVSPRVEAGDFFEASNGIPIRDELELELELSG